MSHRKETIRDGLEIDFDLLDSDLLRCYMRTGIAWNDGPVPRLAWVDFVDRDNWSPEKPPESRVMTRTLDDEQELAEGRRKVRLLRYKSYGCLADLAERPAEPGVFVIRRPPALGVIDYVCQLDEALLPDALGNPDDPDTPEKDLGFLLSSDLADAQRFSHADALRLTARIMRALGYEVPGELGDYYEPVRLDIAEELHARAALRPRRPQRLSAVMDDLSREP